jgi:hypothetical protein
MTTPRNIDSVLAAGAAAVTSQQAAAAATRNAASIATLAAGVGQPGTGTGGSVASGAAQGQSGG